MRPRSPRPIAPRILTLALLVALAAGCSNIYTTRARQLDREVRQDRLEFTEKMRDAYFILGYEYYKLAEEARNAGKTEKANDLYKRATFYTLFYRDMDRLAKDLRFAMGHGTPPEPPANDTTTYSPPSTAPAGFRPLSGAESQDLTTLPALK